MRRWPIAVGTTAVALMLAACGGSSSGGNATVAPQSSVSSSASTSSEGSTDTIAGLSANDHGTMNVTGMSTVNVEADDYYFEPSVLQGTPGQTLTLKIKNVAHQEHNFTMTTQHINKDISDGTTATVKVTMPGNGVLSFYCEYHKTKGMAGGLLVSGDKAGTSAGTSSSSSSSSSGGSGGWG
jgi:plastocyanin